MEKKNEMFWPSPFSNLKALAFFLLAEYSSQQLTNDRNVIYSISIFHTVCPPIDHEEQPIKMGVVFSLYEMIYNKRSS